LLKDILNTPNDLGTEPHDSTKKKGGKSDIHYLEDFTEKDLNKDARGGSSGHHHE
jgi:hypothetical protein